MGVLGGVHCIKQKRKITAFNRSVPQFVFRGRPRAFIVGGGNHGGGLEDAQIFIEEESIWKQLANSTLVDARRSGVITEIGSVPTVVGGVSCAFDSSMGKDKCVKTSSSVKFMANSNSSATFVDDFIVNAPGGWKLSQAKSSSAIAQIPEDYFGSTCNTS